MEITLLKCIIAWMLTGWLSTLLAIRSFRHNRKNIPTGELYQAATGFILGPVILFLLLYDLARYEEGDDEGDNGEA